MLNSSSIYAKDFPVNNEFTVKERIDCAVQASIKYNVPVDVLLAISSIENGNIDTISKNTNNTYDYGVMQINSDYIKDLNSKLYEEYFEGKKDVFDLLYNKYKRKIEFFIFNIVKDYQRAEDITQDVFIYVFQNQSKENYSFKNYLYFVAKSRAISYIETEKRREEITEKYIKNGSIEADRF